MNVTLFCVSTGITRAQNLLSGADFDDAGDLTTHWGNPTPAVEWSAEDFEGALVSGSVLVTNDAAANSSVGPYGSSVPVTPGGVYRASAWPFTPELQTATGAAQGGARKPPPGRVPAV